jgi:UDP-3-O-[3-hydroxymyristoyl] glucosamine N-acyltransferase
MPQIGTVCIEDDVRIGAGSTIDRGTLGETRIGRGTKIDNLVHIGHNAQVGRNVLLCAQVGLSGSVVLEDDVVLAGQVGLTDHVTIGRGAQMVGQSATSVDLKGGEAYCGSPAVPLRDFLRMVRYSRKLPEIYERLKQLEKDLSKDIPHGK